MPWYCSAEEQRSSSEEQEISNDEENDFSAFRLWFFEQRQSILRRNSEVTVGELFESLAKQWGQMTDAEKSQARARVTTPSSPPKENASPQASSPSEKSCNQCSPKSSSVIESIDLSSDESNDGIEWPDIHIPKPPADDEDCNDGSARITETTKQIKRNSPSKSQSRKDEVKVNVSANSTSPIQDLYSNPIPSTSSAPDIAYKEEKRPKNADCKDEKKKSKKAKPDDQGSTKTIKKEKKSEESRKIPKPEKSVAIKNEKRSPGTSSGCQGRLPYSPSNRPCKMPTCAKKAVYHKLWDKDYCSEKCCVRHVKKVFRDFQS